MKMKKFMNAPETVTDEELTGLGLAYPDILDVDGHLVISKDLAAADRVTIVTYGGSGHEPAISGFVGEGMVDISVVGDIFAAPGPQACVDAIKLADKGKGAESRRRYAHRQPDHEAGEKAGPPLREGGHPGGRFQRAPGERR